MGNHYDIAIIGLGCAGSHLVLEFLKKNSSLSIAVIDNTTNYPEKKWSFWEKGIGKWDHLLTKTWSKGVFKTENQTLNFDLKPYAYKTLDSHSFTAFAKAELQNHASCKYINATVTRVDVSKNQHIVHYEGGFINADIVLDSRIDPLFFEDTTAITLQQHFKGWTIKTPNYKFDTDLFTMMDYTLRDPGTTSFTYILPYKKDEALVEFTYFSKNIVDSSVYDKYLETYIHDELGITDYTVLQVEQGIIPMSTYNFAKHNTATHVKVGTAGGWVKPSTGYSFKMTEKKTEQLVMNYLSKKPLTTNLYSSKFALYDTTMLDVLYNHNHDGPAFFEKLYSGNTIQNLFKFLDEETNLGEEISMMSSMTSIRMIKAFFKSIF